MLSGNECFEQSSGRDVRVRIPLSLSGMDALCNLTTEVHWRRCTKTQPMGTKDSSRRNVMCLYRRMKLSKFLESKEAQKLHPYHLLRFKNVQMII